MRRVLIGTPTCRDPKWGYVMSLLRLLWREGVSDNVGYFQAAASSLCEVRRAIVYHAIDGGWNTILWIDDDMVFPPETLDILKKHNVPIVGTNCTTRKPPLHTTASIAGKRIKSAGKSGLEEVDRTGFGVIMTDVEVFKSLPEPWFATPFDPKGFSPTEDTPRDRHYVCEDIWFCALARKFGHKIMVDHDLSVQIGHIGDVEFHHGMLE